MKKNNVVLFSLLIIFLAANCGDSLKNRLIKRLNNFRNALPVEIRQDFDNGKYDDAGNLLDQKLQQVKSYIDGFTTEEQKRQYIRGNYKGLEQEIAKLNIPEDVLKFNKDIYPVIDYECISTFSGQQMVDFFKVYFKEKLETL